MSPEQNYSQPEISRWKGGGVSAEHPIQGSHVEIRIGNRKRRRARNMIWLNICLSMDIYGHKLWLSVFACCNEQHTALTLSIESTYSVVLPGVRTREKIIQTKKSINWKHNGIVVKLDISIVE